ncbi:MAG TPA: hypothetical protein VIW94_07715 [Acidimicrobiia bacterium]
MATAARLSAALSVLLAVTLNLWSSPEGASGLEALLGWVTIGLLAVGLLIGHRGAVAALVVGFILRLGLIGAMGGPTEPDLWVQTVLLVLAAEAAAISFTLRVRPVDPLVATLRSVTTALLAGVAVEVMEQLVSGTDTSGLLVRVAGVAALVVAARWIIRTWRRSGLTA